jgi:IS1 family transposase
MNTLSLARRAAVVRCLIDGASIRATARMTQTDKDTVTKILVEIGAFASDYQNLVLRNLNCTRIEADEIWAFVGAKAGNAKQTGHGDIWTFTGMCADTKLMISWMVGSRVMATTNAFMQDLASRLANRVQLSTDAFPSYPAAVEKAFGWNGVDYATITKKYKGEGTRGRYSPSTELQSVEKVKVMGQPKHSLVSTSYVERTNLSLRMNSRRFTRLTNAFSKKAENHAHAVSLHFMAHNFLRAHGTLTAKAKGLKTSPAMAAGLTDHVWTIEEMLQKLEGSYAIAA